MDSDFDATDTTGDGCGWYRENPSNCGGYDDEDFDSWSMCCGCGGGYTGSGFDETGEYEKNTTDAGCINNGEYLDVVGDDCSWYDENAS